MGTVPMLGREHTMLVITHGGARLLDGRADLSLLAALLVGIANAEAHKRGDTLADGSPLTFGSHSSASAQDYLTRLDPPTHKGDAVVWAWTDEPVAARHVSPVEAIATEADHKRARAYGRKAPAAA
jgi:hypothetical protein